MSANKLLYDFVQWVDTVIEVWPVMGNSSVAPSGEKYLSVCSSGIKPEGYSSKSFGSEDEAVEKYLAVAKPLVTEYGCKDPVLFWRHLPELCEQDGMYRVYSRFVVSPKYEVEASNYFKLDTIDYIVGTVRRKDGLVTKYSSVDDAIAILFGADKD